MTALTLSNITKRFGNTTALDRVSLQIQKGELFFLLGPSGCGKSTLLRIVAGLEAPTEGKVLFDGRDVTDVPTEKRNAVMCFQSYALWPHMSVRQNVEFGLSGISRGERANRTDEVLQLVQMQQYADARPNQLSGGQQQRVALARALAGQPQCLLLDEPLSNLDAALRLEMRSEIRRICKDSGLTTIYVTHDQKEALSVADRIALLNFGRVEQIGTPSELYHRPADSFAARFIGNSNLIPAKLIALRGEEAGMQTDIGTIMARVDQNISLSVGAQVMLSIRPEAMRISNDSASVNRLHGRVIGTTFLGEASEHLIDVAGRKLRTIAAPPIFDVPAEMTLAIEPRDVMILRQ